MSGGFATPLWLELRVPRWWVLSLGLAYAGALPLILLLPLAWYWLLSLLILWLLGAVATLGPLLRVKSAARIERAVWEENEHWQLYYADGQAVPARLAPQVLAAGPILQLSLQTEDGRSLPLLILPGMLDATSLRRLRVRLRLFLAGPSTDGDRKPNGDATFP